MKAEGKVSRLRRGASSEKRRNRRGLAKRLFYPLLAGLAGLCLGLPASAQGSRLEVNAMEYPWSAIGRVNAGGRGYCTGFLVSERHVMTAAHCLYDAVEGRWRDALELHFVAGYQRDEAIIHSKVASYQRSKRASGMPNPDLSMVKDDWALLTLKRPIGRQAGWIGLRHMDGDLARRVRRGDGTLLQAGYSKRRRHIMTASLKCGFSGFFAKRSGIAHGCNVMAGDSGSPLLLFVDGRLYATGVHSLDFTTKDGAFAGAISLGIFRNGGNAEARQSLQKTSVRWGKGHRPSGTGPARGVPLDTIDLMLRRLGYLAEPAGGAIERRAAIEAFQAGRGIAVEGKASLRLLGQLIDAAG